MSPLRNAIKPRAGTLGAAVGFDDADLVANRAGRLGRHQLRDARVYAGIWIVMGLLFLLAMIVAFFAQLNREDHGVADLIAPFVFAIIVCGVCFVLAGMKLKARSSKTKVTQLTGAIQPAKKPPYWFVGTTPFRGPSTGAVMWSNPFGSMVHDHGEFHVYVANGTIVSIEPAGS